MQKKKKIHWKANVCGLTAIELAELEKAAEIKRGKAQAATPEDEDEQGFLISDSPPSVPAWAGGATTLLQRSAFDIYSVWPLLYCGRIALSISSVICITVD